MAVMVVQELLEHEEHQKAERHPHEGHDRIARHRDGCRDHMEECTADQRAGGEGYQGQDDATQRCFREEQRDAAHERDRAHGDATDEDPEERAHGTDVLALARSAPAQL
jgi:hypothetical protein